MINHLGDEVDFAVIGPFAGVKGRITGEGLVEILKNGLKYKK